MGYLNTEGHNWGPENLDGYGISLIVFSVIYSIFFYVACYQVWTLRKHPIIKMRNSGLAIVSLHILHVYMFMVWLVYPLNGAFPCSIEFWVMSLYLPIGFGLFQAANQQLCVVSQDQYRLGQSPNASYKPIVTGRGLKVLCLRIKLWWDYTSSQGKYEGFVAVGIVVQFLVSLVIYCISRKWNSYGIVSHHTTPGLCRRGWEWFPSILWQFLWNYIFGPVLLWRMRGIHDMYHWRLQTTLCIVAGLIGSPLWLAAVLSDEFASVNKYWVPAMWLVPGIMFMQILTLGFPFYEVWKYTNNRRKTSITLASHGSATDCKMDRRGTSVLTDTTGSSNRMWLKSDLDKLLATNATPLQLYASRVELNGENIIFLTEVAEFETTFVTKTMTIGSNPAIQAYLRLRKAMFRVALRIYISLVCAETAAYPINIESSIYAALDKLFGPAAKLVASRGPSSSGNPPSNVAPWEEPPALPTPSQTSLARASPALEDEIGGEAYPMTTMGVVRPSTSNTSTRPIVPAHPCDPLSNYQIPDEFDSACFATAARSITYMVWSETWQRFCNWRLMGGECTLNLNV